MFAPTTMQVRELMDEIEKAKEEDNEAIVGGTAGGKPGQTLASIAIQTTQLQETLSNLKLEESLGSELIKRSVQRRCDN